MLAEWHSNIEIKKKDKMESKIVNYVNFNMIYGYDIALLKIVGIFDSY